VTTRQPSDIHAFDDGRRWALLELCEELVESALVTLGYDLDTAVLVVAHIALEVEAAGRLPGKVAKADTLHQSVHSGL